MNLAININAFAVINGLVLESANGSVNQVGRQRIDNWILRKLICDGFIGHTEFFQFDLQVIKRPDAIAKSSSSNRMILSDIAKAQTETMIKPDGTANDFGRKAMTVVARTTGFYPLSLAAPSHDYFQGRILFLC